MSKRKKGNSFLYDIHCAQCNAFVMQYLKGGRGGLLRCFLTGILLPEDLADLHNIISTKDDIPNLHCPNCEILIGVPMVYKDGRLAFRMINRTFGKRKAKLV